MRSLSFLLLFFFTSCHFSFAQNRLDSLRQLIRTAPDGLDKINALLELADYWRLRKSDSTLVLGDRAEKMALQFSYDEGVLRAASVKGLFLQNQGSGEVAKQIFLKGIQNAKAWAVNSMVPVFQNNLAFIYRREGKRDSAYYYWSEAEKGYEENGFPYEIWRVYSGMGKLFWEKGDLENGEKYLQKSYEITTSRDNALDQGFMLYNLGDFYFSTENFTKLSEIRAIWEERQAKRKPSKEIMELPQHSSMLFLFGQAKPDIIPRLERAANHYHQTGEFYNEAWVLENLGLSLIGNAQTQRGIDALERSLQLFQQYKAKIRSGAVQYQLYSIYKEQGNFEAALAYWEAYNSLKDSLSSTEIENNLAELRVQYDTGKKEQLLRIQDLELQQKKQESKVLWTATVLLALLAGSIFLGFRHRLRANQKLSLQATEIQNQKIRQLEQENQLLSLTAMIEGQETERIRIAQDLHDGIGGLLTTVKAHFHAIQEQVEKLQKLNIYQKTNDLIDEACVEVRRISQNMMPRSLQLLGLKGAIEDLATQLRQKGMECELEIIGLEEGMGKTKTIMLFRIIQELCNNISKHAQAKKVFIQLLRHGQELSLIVEDDGKGFSYESAKKMNSMGLKNIESRVRFLKGDLEVDAVPGEGATIMIRVPVT